jgi:hypothetical protein
MAWWKRMARSVLILSIVSICPLSFGQGPGQAIGPDLTRSDLPVVFNGTIPTLYSYEDNASSGKDLIDLKQYVWDPDGHGLSFSDATPTHWDDAWVVNIKNGVISFHPTGLYGGYHGSKVFDIRAQGPGQDNLWENEDDPNVVFNITLIVLPVNDGAPALEYIIVGDQKIEPSLFAIVSFKVEPNKEWTCDLVYSDLDNDTIEITLIDTSNSTSLVKDTLHFNSSKRGSFRIGIVFNDTWIEAIYYLDLIVEGKIQIPTFLGISFDGVNVAIPVVNGAVNLSFFEDQEIVFYLMFDLPGEYSFTDVGEEPFPIEVLDNIGSLGPFSVPHWGENVSPIIEWSEANGTKGTFGLNVQIVDVNIPPEINSIYGPGNHFSGEASLFYLNFKDSDMDICWYLIDFGDGTPRVNGSASWIEHNYTEPGNYTVSLTVFDGYGSQASSTLKVRVIVRTDGQTYIYGTAEDIPWTRIGLSVIGFIIIYLVLLILFHFRKKPKAEE